MSALLSRNALIALVIAVGCVGKGATTQPQGEVDPAANFTPKNWRTIETLGCYRTDQPTLQEQILPRFMRFDIQRNQVTGAFDSVVGTSSEPGYYAGLASSWSVVGDSVRLQWWNGTSILSVKAVVGAMGLTGVVQPGGDWGEWPVRQLAASAIDCASGPSTWHYISARGGDR